MPPWAIILTVVILAFAVSILNLGNAVPVDTDLKQEDYNGLFANLAFIAIIVERVIEVLNSIWRRKGKVELQRAVDAAKDADRKKAQRTLDDYRSDTETYAMYAGLAIGAVIAISGIHTLSFLYPDISALSPIQTKLFHATDIILTAGLLAGGSKGINGVTSVFGNYLDSTAEKARQSSKP